MCISQGSADLPDEIVDTSTLTISLDNQGMATLQLVILKKDSKPISNFDYSFAVNGGTFRGFLDSDSPRRLEGTVYFEHAIIAKGMIC